MNGWMDGRMDGYVYQCMDGWMDGWTDGCTLLMRCNAEFKNDGGGGDLRFILVIYNRV